MEKAPAQGAQARGFLNALWTLSRVATPSERQSAVRLHLGHVWRLLGRMGWSLQRPGGRIVLVRLPAYAPKLNPTEYIWGHRKRHALANFCSEDIPHLSGEARRQLRRRQRRTPLIRAI